MKAICFEFGCLLESRTKKEEAFPLWGVRRSSSVGVFTVYLVSLPFLGFEVGVKAESRSGN